MAKTDGYLLPNGLTKSPSQPSLWVMTLTDFLIPYHLWTIVSRQANIRKFEMALVSKFEMRNLRLMKYYLGMQVKQNQCLIFLSQNKYAGDLQKFDMLKLQATSSTYGHEQNFRETMAGKKRTCPYTKVWASH